MNNPPPAHPYVLGYDPHAPDLHVDEGQGQLPARTIEEVAKELGMTREDIDTMLCDRANKLRT